MASSVLPLLLSLLLGSSSSLPPPRISFPLNSADRPLGHFTLTDVHNTTTLFLSNDGSTLYVGAQDTVLALDVSQSDVISLKKKVEWSPTEDEIKSCEIKGRDPAVDCTNLVHVLQPINSTHLYACGSYAFNPHHAFIDMESFSVEGKEGAKGRCPFSPFQRSAAVTIDGELFTASSIDFFGLKPQISRYFSKDSRPDVSLESTINLLHEPTFVSSSLDPAEQKLYFFFREVGKEFSFVDELQISRVAQVCKDDVGGERTLQKKWTSFAKAPLLCQPSKQLLFNILQDMFTLQPPEGSDTADTLFYGVFTSQWSSQPESAVCVFKLQDIRDVFRGNYKTLDMNSHQWNQLREQHSYLGKCGLGTSSDNILMQVKSTFLTVGSVKPDQERPVAVFSEHQYSRVAVMRTQAANGKQYMVLFLLTESGFLHKVVLFDQGPRVVEEIQVFTQPQLAKSIVLSSFKGVVYVGTSEGVTAVPVARCSIYGSCSQCLLARDPLCGWSQTRKACTGLDGGPKDMVQNLENDRVEDKCHGEDQDIKTKEISVSLGEAVKLQCLKPSNLATLSWTSSQHQRLPRQLFLQSADGTLSFLASSDTVGSYSCEAEEDGFKEVVVSYSVWQKASPRMLRPLTTGKEEPIPEEDDATTAPSTEERKLFTQKNPGLKSSFTKEPRSSVTTTKTDKFNSRSGSSLMGARVKVDGNLDVTSISKTNGDSLTELSKEKSYYRELIAVSSLLAVCILVIVVVGPFHMWRQRKTGLKADRLIPQENCSKTTTSMEICSLSASPEEAGPDLKVVQ
ncbi:semaphorin-4B-like [Xenentodon cancila]